MIVPMKRVSLVVRDAEREAALVELRRLGVVHLEKTPAASEALTRLLERKARAQNAAGFLRNYPLPAGAAPSVGAKDVEALIEEVLSLNERRKSEFDAMVAEQKEAARIEPWGDFDPADFGVLSGAGVELKPYELSRKTYERLGSAVAALRLSETKSTVRCLVVGAPYGGADAAALVGETPFALPERSLSALRASMRERESRLADIEERFVRLAPEAAAIERELERVDSALEFEAARAGMDSTDDTPEGQGLAWLSGFVPGEDGGRVKRAAADHGWALIIDDPSDTDAPPTKVKNSAMVRIVQPVFDFLGTVPNYREYDISAWFLLFFSFFFAMIFGDGGYGTILLIAGLALAFKAKAAGKPVPDFTRLLLLLAGFSIFWGAVTMSWFGISSEALPGFFGMIDIYWISNANPDSGDNVKVLCFAMGTVQLVIAHLKNIKRDIGSLKFLAQIGQLAMVVGMMSLVLNLVISAERYPLPQYAMYLIAVGFGLNFCFASYESGHGFFVGLLKGIVGSLTNIVSVFLGVVNVFADIVSYIRLWAVGLAGVAISQTVNNMVGPLMGKLSLFAVGVLILVFGHGLNIMMSVLSVIVHGVRLNMLEFSGHLGMEWSGYAYEPFRERLENKDISSKELS
jgi:V/A-type H+-transporting ATPase subunit I